MARIVPSNTVPGARSPISAVVGRSRLSPPAPSIPTLMYDVVTAQANGEQVFRADAFKNSTGQPIEIHSMRVLLEQVNPTATPGANLLDTGGIIALRIAVNGVPLTRGYVPVWNICRSDNRLDSYRGTGIYSYSTVFSSPIPLPAGASISVQAKHLGFTPVSIKAHLSFAGRRGPGLATLRRMPYVVYWQTPAFSYTQVATYTTPPSVLVNDTGRPLNVDRIIGRFGSFSPTGDGAVWSGTNRDYTDWADPTAQGVIAASVRLSMAQDRPVIPAFVPWRAVFGQNAAFETDFVMRPTDYMVADVKHIAGPTTIGTNPPPFFQATAGISFVGWRDI